MSAKMSATMSAKMSAKTVGRNVGKTVGQHVVQNVGQNGWPNLSNKPAMSLLLYLLLSSFVFCLLVVVDFVVRCWLLLLSSPAAPNEFQHATAALCAPLRSPDLPSSPLRSPALPCAPIASRTHQRAPAFPCAFPAHPSAPSALPISSCVFCLALFTSMN